MVHRRKSGKNYVKILIRKQPLPHMLPPVTAWSIYKACDPMDFFWALNWLYSNALRILCVTACIPKSPIMPSHAKATVRKAQYLSNHRQDSINWVDKDQRPLL